MKLSNVDKTFVENDRKEFIFENPNKNKCIDLRHVKVLSHEDWERLKHQLNADSVEEERIEAERQKLEQIKLQSKEMVKNWTNTFLGSRQKKLDDRAKRLAEEEKAKIAVDLEEEKFQAEQRKKAIEKAKLQIYYETDRVKNFHTALNLTEVLKERDAQLELKELNKKLNMDKDKKYVEKMKKDNDEMIKKEQELAEKKREVNKQIAEELKTQIKAKKMEDEKLKLQNQAEGEEMRKRILLDQLEREKLEKIYKEQMNNLLKQYQEQIDGNQQWKIVEKLQDEEIEEKCRLFAAAKIKMTTMRVMKERELLAKREAELEQIRAFVGDQIEKSRSNEEERLQRALGEKEAEYQTNEKEKMEKHAKALEEIAAHRSAEIERHRRELEAEKEADLQEVRERIAAELTMAEHERACMEQRNAKLQELSKEYLQAGIQKRENAKKERQQDIETTGQQNRIAQLEESVFQDYARRVIDHCRANGRNLYALEKAADPQVNIGFGSNLPGKVNLTAQEKIEENDKVDNGNSNNNALNSNQMKNNKSTKSKTKQRLGFVW